MELEIYKAFITAGLPDNLHAQQLVTKADLAEAKVEIIKWTVGSLFAAVGLFAALTKLWQ